MRNPDVPPFVAPETRQEHQAEAPRGQADNGAGTQFPAFSICVENESVATAAASDYARGH